MMPPYSFGRFSCPIFQLSWCLLTSFHSKGALSIHIFNFCLLNGKGRQMEFCLTGFRDKENLYLFRLLNKNIKSFKYTVYIKYIYTYIHMHTYIITYTHTFICTIMWREKPFVGTSQVSFCCYNLFYSHSSGNSTFTALLEPIAQLIEGCVCVSSIDQIMLKRSIYFSI